MRRRRTMSVAASMLAATSALVGCSSNSKSTSSSPTVARNGSPSTSALSGAPVEVELITYTTGSVTWPQLASGAQAAEKAVNASGGIKGRPIKVDVCDAQSLTDPSPAETCARNLVANQSILAEVGDFHGWGQQVNDILNASNVPSIGDLPLSASQLSAPNSFPLSGSEGAGQAVALADAGAKKIFLAYFQGAGTQATIALNNTALKSRGQQLVGSEAVPITSTDMNPYITAAASKGDAVALAITPAQLAQWLKAAKQGNYSQKLSAPGINMLPQALSTLGNTADGLIVESGFPLVSNNSLPGIQRFNQEMSTYEPSGSKDELALNGWISVWTFAQVARTISGPLSRASVMSAMSNLTNFNVFGLLPDGFTTTKPAVSLPGLNRLFNADIVEGVIKNGVPIQTSPGYVPLFTHP